MIIIDNKDIENSVYFPRNFYGDDGAYTLVLNDRASNKRYTFQSLDDRHLVPVGFYTFFIDFSECPKGEYEYEITDGSEKTVGKGLIRLNGLLQDIVAYNNERKYVIYDGQ